MFSAALYARVQPSYAQSHMRPRVQRASGIPCALSFSEGKSVAQLGRIARRGCGTMSRCESQSASWMNHRGWTGCRILRCSKLQRPAPANGQWRFARLLCIGSVAYKLRSRVFALRKKLRGRKHAEIDFGCGIDCGFGPGGPGVGAVADHHQVQPRRGAEHAEGAGAGEIQGTGREVHRRQGQGRGLPELAALQGQGRARGAAARRGADAGAVERQVRPDRRQGIRGVRSAVHPPRPEDAAQGHRRAARRKAAEAARCQGNDRSRLLGQRLQADERQQEAASRRPTTKA